MRGTGRRRQDVVRFPGPSRPAGGNSDQADGPLSGPVTTGEAVGLTPKEEAIKTAAIETGGEYTRLVHAVHADPDPGHRAPAMAVIADAAQYAGGDGTPAADLIAAPALAALYPDA
jgi:hypothetical protein